MSMRLCNTVCVCTCFCVSELVVYKSFTFNKCMVKLVNLNEEENTHKLFYNGIGFKIFLIC